MKATVEAIFRADATSQFMIADENADIRTSIGATWKEAKRDVGGSQQADALCMKQKQQGMMRFGFNLHPGQDEEGQPLYFVEDPLPCSTVLFCLFSSTLTAVRDARRDRCTATGALTPRSCR